MTQSTRSCRFDADFMRMLKVMTKNLRGTNALLVPPDPKVGGGDLSPLVPMVVAPMSLVVISTIFYNIVC